VNQDEEYQDDFGDNEAPKAEYFDGTTDEDYAHPQDGQEQEKTAEPVEVEDKHQEEHKKKKDNFRERFSEVRKENFQVLSENERLRLENEKLRKDAEYYSQSAVKHYDDGITQRLNYAKELYRTAEESGDVDAKVNATQYLAELTAEKNSVRNFQASQQQYQQPQQQPQQQYQQPQQQQYGQQYQQPQQQQQMSTIDYVKDRELQRWDQDNTWFNKNNRDYDPWLAERTIEAVTKLNDDLSRKGGQGWIGTPDYLDAIDEEIRRIRSTRSSQNNRGPNMSQSRMPMHSNRNAGVGGQQFAQRQQEKVPLTKEEISFARLSGVDPEMYRKKKAEDIRVNAHLRENIANRGR
jgi:hypothetical protein